MANHAYVYTGKTLDPDVVNEQLKTIVKEKLNNAFQIEYNKQEMYWMLKYHPDNNYIGLEFWISNEDEYIDCGDGGFESRLVSKHSVIEFRHGHAYQFLWYIEGVIRTSFSQLYNCKEGDDAYEERNEPNIEKYSSFSNYIKGKSKRWFDMVKEEMEEIPEDLINKLNLNIRKEKIKNIQKDI